MLISRLPQLEQGYSLDLDSMIFSRHGTQQQGPPEATILADRVLVQT